MSYNDLMIKTLDCYALCSILKSPGGPKKYAEKKLMTQAVSVSGIVSVFYINFIQLLNIWEIQLSKHPKLIFFHKRN